MKVWVVNLYLDNWGEAGEPALCGVFTTTAMAFERAQTAMTAQTVFPCEGEFYHITEPWGFTIHSTGAECEVWCEIVGVTLNE